MPGRDSLPPQTVEMILVGNLIRVLERKCPGVLDEWLESIEDERLQSEVVRLRGPRAEPTVIANFTKAAAWAAHIRLLFRGVGDTPPPRRTFWDRLRRG